MASRETLTLTGRGRQPERRESREVGSDLQAPAPLAKHETPMDVLTMSWKPCRSAGRSHGGFGFAAT